MQARPAGLMRPADHPQKWAAQKKECFAYTKHTFFMQSSFDIGHLAAGGHFQCASHGGAGRRPTISGPLAVEEGWPKLVGLGANFPKMNVFTISSAFCDFDQHFSELSTLQRENVEKFEPPQNSIFKAQLIFGHSMQI